MPIRIHSSIQNTAQFNIALRIMDRKVQRILMLEQNGNDCANLWIRLLYLWAEPHTTKTVLYQLR